MKSCSFTSSIRREIRPQLGAPSILIDLETDESLEVTPGLRAQRVRARRWMRTSRHLRDRARGSGMDYYLLVTDKPLDGALREYLTIRQGRF